jgi:protein involved in polysaccharide export with SLBB domain
MSLIRLLKRQGKVVGKTAAIFMSLILGAALAQAQVAPAAPPVGAAPAAPVFSTVPTEDGYVLGVGDVIAASVLGRTEFNSQVQIQADGTRCSFRFSAR